MKQLIREMLIMIIFGAIGLVLGAGMGCLAEFWITGEWSGNFISIKLYTFYAIAVGVMILSVFIFGLIIHLRDRRR